MSRNKKEYETPYIARLDLDNRSHLIAHLSDGINTDVGYLPTNGIMIHTKEVDDEKHYTASSHTTV